MGHLIKFITITVTILLVFYAPAQGQTGNGEVESSATMPRTESDQVEGSVGIHFQVGGAYRFATNVEAETKQTYLITGDLSWLKLSRIESTWGLGIHFAFDDSGHRLGAKGLWRTPLKKGTWSYFQLAPGIYISATEDTFVPLLPGFFLEAELGLAHEFSFVLVGEIMPYEDRARDTFDSFGNFTSTEESGKATAYYAGVKVGQKGGMVIVVLGVIAGIAAGISFASSGFM